MGQKVSAADYLLAIEDCQAFARAVAQFLTTIDVWLTPTMSTPPALIGEITSTVAEPLRALERGGPTVAYAGVVANITGSPAMSVPLWQNTSGLPIGVHFLGRYGDEATLFRLASQLESARPWSERKPPVTTGTELPGMTYELIRPGREPALAPELPKLAGNGDQRVGCRLVGQIIELGPGQLQLRVAPPDLTPGNPHQHLMQPGQRRLPSRAGAGEHPQPFR